MTYAVHGDITARLPWVTWSASSKPSTTDLTNWITLAEGMLTAALKAAEITTPITDTDGIQLAKSLVCDYVEGRARIALSSSVDSSDAQIGASMVKDFKDLITKMAEGSGVSLWASMMTGGAEQTECAVRGHVRNNADGETIANGDFDPEFERDEVW